jgi:LytR cell envelope-related transcriptional attenuator
VTAPRGDGGGRSRSSGISSAARGAIVVGLAVILGIIGLQILDDSSPGTAASDTTVTTIAGVTPSTSATGAGGTSTTSGRRPPSQVKVKVYNASGVQGRAQILSDKLRASGYNLQDPANLSSQRAGTVVECKKGFDAEGTLLALYGVGDGATVQPYPSAPPAGASEADCIVVIGTA